MPPNVIILKLCPIKDKIKIVAARARGTVNAVINVTHPFRKNTHKTKTANPRPINKASRTVAAEATINSL